MNLDPKSIDQQSQSQRSTTPRSASTSSLAPHNVYTLNSSPLQPHSQSPSSVFIPNAYQIQTSFPPMYHQFNPNMFPMNPQNMSTTNMSPLPPIIASFPNSVPSISSFPSLQTLPPNNISPHNVLPLINAATLRTMQRTDDLVLNDQFISSQSAPQHIYTAPASSSTKMDTNEKKEDDEDDDKDVEIETIQTNNPWFNEEIASIVKLHRKTARKCHRSKTNKKKLKEICKKLEKKKRKLIKAAKQKYMRQLVEQTTKTLEVQNIVQSETKYDKDCKKNDENISGYLPFYMVQLVGEILWSHFADGKHWKVDVDDILESDDNRQESTHLFDWMKQIKDSGWEQWGQLKSGYHWKVDVIDILSS